jgi:patatin-like phospholipase/acyl hydrolase
MARYRILSLDGGGIRGLLTAILLERLDAGVPGWRDKVDVIAGTSTGGVIALGLAHGLSPTALRQLYEKKGSEIFDDSWLDNLMDLGTIAGAQYDNRNLARELRRVLGNTMLKHLGKRVVIPTFDLDNEDPTPGRRSWKPKIFHNFPGEDSDGNAHAWKVALYTSAAPTYFPTVDGYIDGGVFANNPSLCALAQSQDARALHTVPALSEISLLSLGTGISLTYIKGQNLDWGYAQWAKPLLNILMDGVSGIADYQCRKLLGKGYHRLAPVFEPGVSVPLDDVKHIPYLVGFANKVKLEETAEWLKTAW